MVALCGIYPDPESLAHGGDGTPHKPLYRVEFPRPTSGTTTAARPPTACKWTSTSNGWSGRHRISSVIPAKAGIHVYCTGKADTVRKALDSRLRGNDGVRQD